MSNNKSQKVSYDLDTKFISAACKLKAAPKVSEGEFAKAFEKAGNFGDKLNVIGKYVIGRTDLYSVILDINKDIKADLEDEDNVKRLIQSLYVSALIKFKFIPKVHEELRGYVPTEFQILERQIHQLVAAIIDGKDEVEVTADEADQAPEEEIGAEKQEDESIFAQMLGNAAEKVEKVAKKAKDKVKKAKAENKKEDVKDEKKEEKVEAKTEAKEEQVNVNPVQPVVEDEKAQRPATDANNTFYQTLKELEAIALQREAYWYASHSPMDNNAEREIAYQQFVNQFGVDPILIPEYRAFLARFLNPDEAAMFFADVQQPGFVNPQQPMGYQPQPQPMVAPQPVAPAQATVSTAAVQDVQPAQAPQQPVQVDAPQPAPADAPQATISTVEPQAKVESKDKVVKEKLETTDRELTECVAKYLGYSSYKHFMNTFLDANALKRKAKINKLVDTDKIILNFTYFIRDMITKGGNTLLADAVLKGGRFRVSGVQMVDKTPFVVLRNNKMVLEINDRDYLKRGNVVIFRINAQGKDAWYWMRIQTGEIGQYMIHQQPVQQPQTQQQKTA